MRETTDRRDKLNIAKALTEWRHGRISRRTMLGALGAAGVGLMSAPRRSSANVKLSPYARLLLQDAPDQQSDDITAWLRDVGGQFSGTTIKAVVEDTPPGNAINQLKGSLFEELTGITVEWEVLPLDQVLSRISQDTASQAGTNDIFYLDQAWVGRFINDCVDPRELLESQPDLAYPDYNFDDFLEPLVRHIAMYEGKAIGAPCDVPIFMHFYRTDIYDEMGLTPATTLEQYLDNARAINEEYADQGTYGTVGQMRSGHYALQCDMTAWLWGHGGSIFYADGECALGDEQAMMGINYLLDLQQTMPSAVTTYDWGGQATAIQQGQGGQVITWGENFPGWDQPDSPVSALLEPADLPAATALRSPEECGYEETPEVGHQGGSTYGLSRYSQNADAAWVFLQWATSSNTQTLASVIGGGASPMRQSTFDDPRLEETNQVGVAGTTRHFDAMYKVINERMGTEPHLPAWPDIATDILAVELGRLTTGGYDSAETWAEAVIPMVMNAAGGGSDR